MHLNSKKPQTRRTNVNPKIKNKSPIHENTNAKIICDFGDDRCRIAIARLEKDIFVKTHLHTARTYSSIDIISANLHAIGGACGSCDQA